MNIQYYYKNLTGHTTPVGAKIDNSLKIVIKELTDVLTPKAENPYMQNVLGRISNLSFLEKLDKAPTGRCKDTISGDNLFRKELLKLLYKGTIKENIMIISNTGHDIPLFAQLSKTHLKFHAAFDCTCDSTAGNIDRISNQIKTFGHEILDPAETVGNKCDGIFIGIDVHRSILPYDIRKLPTLSELKNLGIKRVVSLAESEPSQQYTVKNTSSSLRPYFENLEKNGLKVSYHGVDARLSKSTHSIQKTCIQSNFYHLTDNEKFKKIKVPTYFTKENNNYKYYQF